MTASDVMSIAREYGKRISEYWPSMSLTVENAASDGIEVRVMSGKDDLRRYGVVVFLDRDMPRLPREAARAMVRDLVTSHVEYCLEGRK
jgi:hypothetical protein